MIRNHSFSHVSLLSLGMIIAILLVRDDSVKITVIGVGVVGATTADCFRRFGHIVSCVNVD